MYMYMPMWEKWRKINGNVHLNYTRSYLNRKNINAEQEKWLGIKTQFNNKKFLSKNEVDTIRVTIIFGHNKKIL